MIKTQAKSKNKLKSWCEYFNARITKDLFKIVKEKSRITTSMFMFNIMLSCCGDFFLKHIKNNCIPDVQKYAIIIKKCFESFQKKMHKSEKTLF